MNKIKKILVATDFSEHSQHAILKAVDMAKQNNATLVILHVAKKDFLTKVLTGISPKVGKILVTPQEYAESLLKEQVAKLSKHKIKMTTVILSGEYPARKILKYAKDNQVDLLVMGAHGYHSLHDWVVGTTAEYAAKKTRCPVLLVKKTVKKPYKKILVPIDFSKTSKNALDAASQWFPKAGLRVLHVGDHEYESVLKQQNDIPAEKLKTIRKSILFMLSEKVRQFIKGCHLKVPYDIKIGYPAVVIIDEAKRLNRDLVVMGTEGHSQKHYLYMGRVASQVLVKIDKDILLIPPKNKK